MLFLTGPTSKPTNPPVAHTGSGDQVAGRPRENGQPKTVELTVIPANAVVREEQEAPVKSDTTASLRARFEGYKSFNTFETEEYRASIPFVLRWLKARIEEGKAEKADYLTAATICLPVKHDLYEELLKLWTKSDDKNNLAIVTKMVDENPVFEPKRRLLKLTPESATPMFDRESKGDPFENFIKLQNAIKIGQPVEHNNVIFAITELTVAGYQRTADLLCSFVVKGKEQGISLETLENIENALLQDIAQKQPA